MKGRGMWWGGLLLALVVAGGCKKSGTSGGGSGSNFVPQAPIGYSGNPGKLGGDWSGQNSSGGAITFRVENGFIKGYSNSWVGSAGVRSQTYEERIEIDAAAGTFNGYLGEAALSGTFVSDASAQGTIRDLSGNDLPDLSWTAAIKTPRPDGAQVNLEIRKSYSMGVITDHRGVQICDENEYACNAAYTPGAQVTLTASAASPLYFFNGWETYSDCRAFGTSPCSLTLDVSKDADADFQEINIDGTYHGTTSQGKSLTISLSDNIPTVTADVVMGTDNCVFRVVARGDYNVFYVNDEIFPQELLFVIAPSDDLFVAGGFQTPTTVNDGFLSYSTLNDPSVAVGCKDEKYVTFTVGGGVAGLSAMSAANPAMKEQRARQLEQARRQQRR